MANFPPLIWFLTVSVILIREAGLIAAQSCERPDQRTPRSRLPRSPFSRLPPVFRSPREDFSYIVLDLMTTPERWRRLERLHREARALTTPERDAFLERACDGDESLRGDVEVLLRAESPADDGAASGASTISPNAAAKSSDPLGSPPATPQSPWPTSILESTRRDVGEAGTVAAALGQRGRRCRGRPDRDLPRLVSRRAP